MPFTRFIEGQEVESPAPPDTHAALKKGILDVITKAHVLEVRRHERNRKPRPLFNKIRAEYNATTDDADTLAGELATAMIEIAATDAGDKRLRYQFLVLSEPLPQKDAGELFALDAWINPDDIADPTATKASEHVALLRQARDQNAQLFGETIKIVGCVTSLCKALERPFTEATHAHANAWMADVYRDQMKYDHDIAGAQLIANMENTRSRHKMYTNIVTTTAPIVESVLDAMNGRPPKDGPTAVEIDKIFGEHAPDLRDLALLIIRTQDAAAKLEHVRNFATKWKTIPEDVQSNCMKAAFASCGQDRAMKLASWVAAIVKQAEAA